MITQKEEVVKYAILRKIMQMEKDLDKLETAQAHSIIKKVIEHIQFNQWENDLTWAKSIVTTRNG